MTQRKQVFSRAVVWRPSVLAAGAGGGLGWLIGIGSLAMGGVGPFIAAGPIMAALAGVAVGAAAEIRHDIAEKVGATLRASAPQPTPSANGPGGCPLCVAHQAPSTGQRPVSMRTVEGHSARTALSKMSVSSPSALHRGLAA